MLQNDLIKYCRYYKGQKKCPKSIENIRMANIWDYERMWVERDEFRDETTFNTEEYIHYGMKDFNADDGTPLTLKALLFNRHTHWCGGYGRESDTKNFIEWYNNYYIALSK